MKYPATVIYGTEACKKFEQDPNIDQLERLIADGKILGLVKTYEFNTLEESNAFQLALYEMEGWNEYMTPYVMPRPETEEEESLVEDVFLSNKSL